MRGVSAAVINGQVGEVDHENEATPHHKWPQPHLSSGGEQARSREVLVSSQGGQSASWEPDGPWSCSHAPSPFQKEKVESGNLGHTIQLPPPQT